MTNLDLDVFGLLALYLKTKLYLVIDYIVMIKRLSVLLSILCLFVADVGWANIYYLRADGTAANKAAATSGASASTAMSVATHNSQTFMAGDHIRLCDTGGTYKTSLVAPSSGKDGHPIVYEAAPGQHPVIDLSMDIGSGGWNDVGGGVYQKKGYGRVLWEDGVPLHPATNTSCTDGKWFYEIGSGILQYKPTSGTPADHNIQVMWFATAQGDPFGIDIRDRSNIEISGLTLHRCGIGHSQNISGSPPSLIKNISIHDNIINNAFWAIWGNLKNNGIEQDVEIYNNQINFCNSGISIWTASDTTVGHTQHPLRIHIHNNTINNLYSLDATHDWTYALLYSGYPFTDHEGISFQDPVDCTVADNVITTTTTRDFTDWSYWTRAITVFTTTNTVTKSSGNQFLRNRFIGRFASAIYWAGIPDTAGTENNLFAFNVLQSDSTATDYWALVVNFYGHTNPATGMNYWVNNTINYSGGVGYGITLGYQGSDPGYWTIQNNITQKVQGVLIGNSASPTHFTIDHNYYSKGTADIWYFSYGGSAMTWSTWRSSPRLFDTLANGSYAGATVARLRSSDSALITASPDACKTGGTPIEGITVSGGIGLLGIDGKAFDPVHPAMGAYAQPVNDDKPTHNPSSVGAYKSADPIPKIPQVVTQCDE